VSHDALDHHAATQEMATQALVPYLERIRAWCSERQLDGAAGPTRLSAGERSVQFDPPEFALIHHSSLVGGGTGREGADLPARVAATLLKSGEDRSRLQKQRDPGSTIAGDPMADLLLDRTLGAALLVEIQEHTDALVAGGQMEQAKLFSKLTHRVWRMVAELEKQISEARSAGGDELASPVEDRSLAAGTAGRTSPPLAGPLEPTEAESQIELDRVVEHALDASFAPGPPGPGTRRPRAGPSTTVLLLGALVLTSLAWIGMSTLGARGKGEPAGLTLEAFDGALAEIETRPPSLYGTVERARWEALDAGARSEVVERVAEVLNRHGYRGALLRTEDGVPVAQWLKQRGVLLLEPRESPRPAPRRPR
jgi:hypothetical protein